MEAYLHGKPGTPKPRPIKELPEAVAGCSRSGDEHDRRVPGQPPVKQRGKELTAEIELRHSWGRTPCSPRPGSG